MRQRRSQGGFSLVELMVASVIGLLIAAALTAIFVANSRSRTEIDQSHMQIENGRYALELLSEEIRLAGFYANLPMGGTNQVPASPCAITLATLGWRTTPTPLQVPTPVQVFTAAVGCLTDRDDDWPAIAIRRLSTEAVAPAAVSATERYLQVSACESDPVATRQILGDSADDFTLRNMTCDALAPVRRLMQRTYFVAPCSNCGSDSIPSLKRVELAGGALELRTLVEGIQALAFDLGFDTNLDGAPDVWRTGLDGVANSPQNDWSNVMTVRIHVLTRSLAATPGYTDTRVYDLGLAGTVGPFNDAFKRRVYSSVVRLNNPAGRRE